MLVSVPGLAAIQRHEGLRLDAYQDSAGVWTIGYGSTKYADGTPVRQGDMLQSNAAADALFRETLREYESAVSRSVLVPLSQPQFDALVSLAYNIGTQAFRDSTLLKRLNTHDYAGAANEFLRWNKAGGQALEGLRRRREAERALFLSGTDTRPNDAMAGFDLPNLHTHPTLSPADNSAKLPIKPMAPLVPALIGLLSSVAPDLVRIFSDKDKPVSERNTEAAIRVLDIAKQVAGTETPAAAVEQIVADPGKQAAFREAVVASWYELSPGDGGGVTGARKALAEATAAPGWAGVLAALNQWAMDAAVVGGGGYVLWSVVTNPETSSDIRSLIIGSIAGYIAAVVQFRYGSSVSSRQKDAALMQVTGK